MPEGAFVTRGGGDLLIGLDIGSGSTKATVVGITGEVMGVARQEYAPERPAPGIAEYDPENLVAASIRCLREVIQRSGAAPERVAALTVDAMISGTVGVDTEGRATTPYTTTLDTRFSRYLDQVLARHGDEIRRLTGSGQPTLAPKLAWIRDSNPGAFARTAKFVTAGGYVGGRLANLRSADAYIDPTYLWGVGLSDTEHGVWSDELCEALDCPRELLPMIVPSTTIVGGVSVEVASATGLLAGTPIVAGCGDQSAGFIGAGILRPGTLADSAGTYAVLALVTEAFRPDVAGKRVDVVASPLPDTWHVLSLVVGGGMTRSWVQDLLADRPGAAGLSAAAAALEPGSAGLRAVPHLAGQATPPHSALRGCWLGFSWSHRPEHFFRSMLEAVAFDHANALASLRATYPETDVQEIVGYGGGAVDPVWNQIKADVLGLPYVSLGDAEVTGIGAALLGGFAVGLIDDLAFPRLQGSGVQRFEPVPEHVALYQPLVEEYRSTLANAYGMFESPCLES